MEAAAARAAARDRFNQMGDPAPSPLLRYIQQACSPENFEPNLALNLEISDLINSKKGNTPREAAVAIVNYVNHRNPNVALLALSLLDICVKNCGYPFHLQISTKEFLNELVRRFPERPPLRATRVQQKILEAIEEWRGTICQTSRYKEDLGFIRDMHRLLSYKGYIFPEVRREDAAVLNPSDNLKSAEEMEEEERAAQAAKLQELIRRGGPEDLQEANRLMKVMAGYDTRQKTDYRAKAAEEVGKIQQKARLLEERLETFKPGDSMSEGDVFEELASALQNAQPKIQRMCEEESEDHEAVAKLFEINDSIHRTVERYKLIKKGDIEAASRIAKGTLGTSTGVGKNADNELSLIDFDADATPNGLAPSQTQSQPGGLEDDLLGLSMGEETGFGQGGGISLGFGNNTGIPGPALLSSTTQGNTAKASPSKPPLPPDKPKPNYSAFSAFGAAPISSQTSIQQPSFVQQQQPQHTATSKSPPSDPFAPLSTSLINHAASQHAPPATSKSLFDFSSPSSAQPAPTTSTEDDEWAFSSALPESNGLPATKDLTVSNTKITIAMYASRKTQTDPTIVMALSFSNNTSQPITELTFQMAVTKARCIAFLTNSSNFIQGYTLKMEPQTGRRLTPNESHGIKQNISLNNIEYGKGNIVKLRWKVSYRLGADLSNEGGEISSLGVA